MHIYWCKKFNKCYNCKYFGATCAAIFNLVWNLCVYIYLPRKGFLRKAY